MSCAGSLAIVDSANSRIYLAVEGIPKYMLHAKLALTLNQYSFGGSLLNLASVEKMLHCGADQVRQVATCPCHVSITLCAGALHRHFIVLTFQWHLMHLNTTVSLALAAFSFVELLVWTQVDGVLDMLHISANKFGVLDLLGSDFNKQEKQRAHTSTAAGVPAGQIIVWCETASHALKHG